jgi:hypothetical protein
VIRNTELTSVEPQDGLPLVWIDGTLANAEAASLLDRQRANKISFMDFPCYTSHAIASSIRTLTSSPSSWASIRSSAGGRRPTVLWPSSPRTVAGGNVIRSIQEEESAGCAASREAPSLNNRKFYFRFFLLIGGSELFSTLICREGIARFCTQNYIF